MLRFAFAVAGGGLFGMGLVISGMTDTRKVQGFLDITGAWDPTLAFVMGAALLPMAVAWFLAKRMTARGLSPALGGTFPRAAHPRLDRKLVIGSLMFGIGWGLVGLCPGPALASITYGGSNGLIFLAAMSLGMWAALPLSTILQKNA